MAHNEIILDDLVELINHHGGIDALGEAIGTLMNAAMRMERAEVVSTMRAERVGGFGSGRKEPLLATPARTYNDVWH